MLLLPPSPGESSPVEFGSGPSANTDYVAATNNSLVTNGLGELANNYNFPDFVFDPVIAPNVKGSFRRDGYYAGALRMSENILIDPSSIYKMGCSILQEYHALMTTTGHTQYFGLICVDIDGFDITPVYTMSDRLGGVSSRTTLAAPLSPGDMVMTVADASGWNNASGTSSVRRGAIIWEYKNSFGFKYDFYSRLRTSDLWDPGAVNAATGVITLKRAFPTSMGNPDDAGGTWPIGTRISNPSSGGTYKYVAISGNKTPLPDKWYRATGFIGGIDNSGTNYTNNFAPGTAFVAPMMLANYSNRSGGYAGYPDTGPDHSVYFAKVTMNKLEDNTVASRNADGHVDFKVPKPNDATNVIDLVLPARTFPAEI